MCYPAVAIGLAVAAAAVSAYSAYEQGQAQKKAANYQAQVEENNAKIANYQAQDAVRKGEEDAQQVYKVYAQKRAAGAAEFAAGNVQLGTGSAGLWDVGMSKSLAEDVNTVKYNAALDAWNYKIQGSSARDQAKLNRFSGTYAERAGYLSAGSSLLAGASTVAGRYGK